MSDQDRIFPNNINIISSRLVMRIKKIYQLGDYELIQYQILQTNITRTVWETVRRVTNEILGVKGLRSSSLTCNRKVPSLHHSWFFAFFSLKWQVSGLSVEKCYVNITQACRAELCHRNSTSSKLLYSVMKTEMSRKEVGMKMTLALACADGSC